MWLIVAEIGHISLQTSSNCQFSTFKLKLFLDKKITKSPKYAETLVSVKKKFFYS